MNSLLGQRVAIANRGEIAIRIATTCRQLGAVPILLAAESDLTSAAARVIGRCEVIGPAGSELAVAMVVAAARRARADLLHPGYGFLSERAELAAACREAGIGFVGPSPETLRLCGDKMATRVAAADAGVPVLPASPSLGDDPADWLAQAGRVGFPLFVKPALAGGGRGLRRVIDAESLVAAVSAARSESAASGAGSVIFLERALEDPRHVEVQVVGAKGRILALGDRDCSLQRRHQKLIEEAPAPDVPPALRQQLHQYACRVAAAVALTGVATCEFLLDRNENLSFLEVNPRLQVEHPVTEAVTGLDLVAWQLLIATGADLPTGETPMPLGHAIEARVCAEDPTAGFRPSPGRLSVAHWPRQPAVRVDAGYLQGDIVPPSYDSLIGKVIAHGADRPTAVAALREALRETLIAGIPTNVPWLLAALDTPDVAGGRTTTSTATRIPMPAPDPARFVLAAAARSLARPVTTDPWSAIGPFRLSGSAQLVFHGDGWEQSLAVRHDATGWQIDIGSGFQPFQWWQDDGIWTVAAGDEVNRYAIQPAEEGAELVGAAGRLFIQNGPRVADRSTSTGIVTRDGLVRAPIPGRILQIEAAVGHHVERGQTLVTMNAMKIDIELDAPLAGTISAVNCEPGDQVDAGTLLVQVSPARADRNVSSPEEVGET